MNKIAFVCIIALCSIGCASQNTYLESQVATLEAREKEQSAKIKELQEQLAVEQKNDVYHKTVEGAQEIGDRTWEWVKSTSSDAWNSETSVEYRKRLSKCMEDLKSDNSSKKN